MRIQKTCRGCGKVFWVKVPSKKSKKEQNPLKLMYCQSCRHWKASEHTHKSEFTAKDDVNLLVYLENKYPKEVERLRTKDLNKPE